MRTLFVALFAAVGFFGATSAHADNFDQDALKTAMKLITGETIRAQDWRTSDVTGVVEYEMTLDYDEETYGIAYRVAKDGTKELRISIKYGDRTFVMQDEASGTGDDAKHPIKEFDGIPDKIFEGEGEAFVPNREIFVKRMSTAIYAMAAYYFEMRHLYSMASN